MLVGGYLGGNVMFRLKKSVSLVAVRFRITIENSNLTIPDKYALGCGFWCLSSSFVIFYFS